MPVVITFDEAKPDPAILLKVWRQCTSQTNPETVTLSDAGLPTTIGGYGVTVSYGEDAPAPKLTVVPSSPPATEMNIKHLFSLYREVEGGDDDDRHEFTREVLGHRVSWSWNRAEMTVNDYEKLVAALGAQSDDDEWIDHATAQRLHQAWRDAPGYDKRDSTRHDFTRATLGRTPRWHAGGMTNRDARRLLTNMK